MYDLVIIGSGPAGLSAAVYAKRACLDVVVLEKEPMGGGQMIYTQEVDNYLGLPETNGFDLAQKFEQHAKALEVPFISDEVKKKEKNLLLYIKRLESLLCLRSLKSLGKLLEPINRAV